MNISVSNGSPLTPTDNIEAEIDNIGLQRVDEANAVARPAEIDRFYVEAEMDHRADEQSELWDAAGESAARPARAESSALAQSVEDLEDEHAEQGLVVDKARKELRRALRALGRHVRRAPKAARLFYLRMLAIFLGDIAGVASASILFGLIPWMAILQAAAIGAAVVAAGTVASEWKDLQAARDREKPFDDLTKNERGFSQFFSGPRKGEAYAKIALGVALFVLVLVFGGIFALQSAIDSTLAGIMFGCFGAAIGLASFCNYYSYTDEVADLLDDKQATLDREVKRLHALRDHPMRQAFYKAKAEADSIKAEYAHRGKAARQHVLALKFKVLRKSTGVVGHGFGVKQPTIPDIDLSTRLDDDLEQLLDDDGGR